MKKNCHTMSQLLSDQYERKLSWREWMSLKLHLSLCRLCQSYALSLDMLHNVLLHIQHHDAAKDVRLSLEARHRIQQILKREVQ